MIMGYFLYKRMIKDPQPDDWKIPIAILIVAVMILGLGYGLDSLYG